MEQAAFSQPNLSFYGFENAYGNAGQLETLNYSNTFGQHGVNDTQSWHNNWHHSGFYIGDNSSSEVSLQQGLTPARPGSPVGSDCSWTEEDDTNSAFVEVPQLIYNFLRAPDQTSLMIPALNSRQRRVVHGMAHMMHLGHESYKSEGEICRMHIFKKTESAQAVTNLRNATSMDSMEESVDTEMDRLGMEPLKKTNSSPAKLSNKRGFKYRMRLPRLEDGYLCSVATCRKPFHRACDRDKHEEKHGHRPHKCIYEECAKTFRYPKDLRRHLEVHARRANQEYGPDDSPDNYFSETSSCSEAPSLAMSVSSAGSTPASFDFGPFGVEDPDRTPMPKLCPPFSDM